VRHDGHRDDIAVVLRVAELAYTGGDASCRLVELYLNIQPQLSAQHQLDIHQFSLSTLLSPSQVADDQSSSPLLAGDNTTLYQTSQPSPHELRTEGAVEGHMIS